jgi:dTDP-4-dehydrorhamnose reductase
MSSMKILITGGSGVLGQYLNCYLSRYNEILTIYHSKPGNCLLFNTAKADITDYRRMHDLFAMFRPDVVIHSAAYSSPVTAAGITPSDIYNVNVKATEKIAELCNHSNAKMIYISTDLVYAGYRGSFLKEDGKLIPASLYAETKLVGEKKTAETAERYLILRMSLLYGFGLNGAENFFNRVYSNLKHDQPVKLFTDQYRSPLSLHNAAVMMEMIIESDMTNTVLNFGGNERVSRYQLGEILCESAGFNKDLLQKTSLDEMPEIPKVEDVSMDISKIKNIGILPLSIKSSMDEIIEKMKDFCPENI